MGTIARTAKAGGGTNYNSGQTIDPDENNTDENTLFTEVNGLLDDGNIETATIPGAKSLRGTEISDPSSPTSNDILLYAGDDGNGTTVWKAKDSAGLTRNILCWTLAGSDNTERTTQATSTTDLSTISVSIPVGDSFYIVGKYRKTSGHASAALLGLKINGTQITTNYTVTSTTDRAEDGTFGTDVSLGGVFVGATDYLHSFGRGLVAVNFVSSSGALVNAYAPTAYANSMPTATITSIVITGHVTNALNTLAVDDIRVYRLAGF